MTTANLALMKGLTAKMGYLNKRQSVITGNIANADTPGYRPQDVQSPKFDQVLERVERTAGRKSGRDLSMAATSAGHMVQKGQTLGGGNLRRDDQREVYEVSPSGNAVVMEEQMINSQKTVMDYNLMTSIYQKNIQMIKTSIGRGQ